MKIIYLHQYFNTPTSDSNVFGTRSYEFAKRLVNMGHEVHMVTSRTKPTPEMGTDWYETNEDGIRVHWLPVLYKNHMGFFGRVKAFLRFALKTRKKAASLDGDIIYATSTPLTIAIPALYAQKKKKIPMVFEVRDLWPEAPIQLGMLTNPVFIWAARQLEKRTYNRSAHIVTLSPGMQAGVIKNGIPKERTSMIPNSSDLHLFRPDVDGTDMRKKLGLNGKFSLGYFGTMGLANGLGFVLDAAAELKKRNVKDVVLVLHGHGKERAALEERKEKEQLDNVIFSKPIADKTKIAEIAAALDVCMTIYKNLPILYTCSPNKMFDSLAAGKPVLVNMPGWLSDTITQNNCGVAVKPDDVADFVDKILFLRDNEGLREEMGKNSRKLAEKEFSRDLLAVKLETILKNAINN